MVDDQSSGRRMHVMSWDWREQPDIDQLAQAVWEQSGGRVHVTEVETGDDQYAIVIAGRPLTEQEALDAYRGQDEQGAP